VETQQLLNGRGYLDIWIGGVIVTCPESYHIYLGPIFITQPIYTTVSKIILYLHTHSSDT